MVPALARVVRPQVLPAAPASPRLPLMEAAPGACALRLATTAGLISKGGKVVSGPAGPLLPAA